MTVADRISMEGCEDFLRAEQRHCSGMTSTSSRTHAGNLRTHVDGEPATRGPNDAEADTAADRLSDERAGFPDLIFISIENWDEIWRRNQFVCAELARRFPGMKLLFVGLPRDVSHALRTGDLSGLRGRAQAGSGGVDGLANVRVTRPIKLLPNKLSLGRKINEWLFRRHLARAARQMGLSRPVLWLNPHFAVHMAGRMGESAVIYDITDDWTTLSQSPALTKLVRRQDQALCRRADAVIVCSKRLHEMKAPLTDKLCLVPNGVDVDHYAAVLDGAGPLPPEAARWPKPVLGYTGTIHPDRVDVDLVESLAAANAGGSVVLIGPDHLSPADRQRLARLSNVFLPGPRPYAELPAYMRAFDVCIVPHRMTAFTESLNPIKLWEYLAAGKPIVSTDVAGFRDFPRLVRIAKSAEEFARATREAMNEDNSLSEARRQEARRHSWAQRVDEIETVIRGAIKATRRRSTAGVQA